MAWVPIPVMPEPQRLWGEVKPEFRFQSSRIKFSTVTFACPRVLVFLSVWWEGLQVPTPNLKIR